MIWIQDFELFVGSIGASSRDELCERACDAFSTSTIYDLRELRVEPTEQGILITGAVTSFYHKQLAQELVRGIVEGLDVEIVNAVDVVSRSSINLVHVTCDSIR